MILFNPLDYLISLPFSPYLFGAFGFLGLFFALRKLILNR